MRRGSDGEEEGTEQEEVVRVGRRPLDARLLRHYEAAQQQQRQQGKPGTKDRSEHQAKPLAWGQMECDAVQKRPPLVPLAQAVAATRGISAPPPPAPMDVVTAALEGRLRSPGTGGVDKHREQAERLVSVSEAAPPEKEVERRVVQVGLTMHFTSNCVVTHL